MPIPAIVSALAPQIIGGIMGSQASSGARDSQSAAMKAALDAIANVDLPDTEKQKLLLELPQLVGEYQNKLEVEGQTLAPSAMQGIQADPALKAAQRGALESLSTIGSKGLTDADKVEMAQARREASALDQSRQAQIMNDMAARGMSGSGSELIAKLKSGQNAAQNATLASENTLMNAQKRALESIGAAGNLAGQLRGQDFNEESQKAQAADIINKFNLVNTQDVAGRNIERINQQNSANLANKQRIADQSVALKNQQQSANKALLQQQFDNEMRKASGVAGANTQQANFQGAEANRIGNQYAQIGAGVGEGLGAIYKSNQDAAREAKSDNFQQQMFNQNQQKIEQEQQRLDLMKKGIR